MAFNDLITKYNSLLLEQDPASQDAADPAPQQAAPAEQPKTEPTTVPPEGYVDMVRLLAKALVMTIPAGSIDTILTTPVTKENATTVREALQDAISINDNYADNPQRIENPHAKEFIESINERNFMAKYKEILNVMKRYSNDIAA